MSYESIPGWFAFGAAYDEMVDLAVDGDAIIEIGVAFGRSLAYLARRVIDSGKKVRVIGVDPWLPRWDPHPDHPHGLGLGGEHADLVMRLGGPFKAFEHMMLTHALDEYARVDAFRGTSEEAAQVFYGVQPVGVLIDGSHDYAEVKRDIELWLPRVASRGGILAGDDWEPREFPGVVQACDEAFGRSGYEVRGTTWIRRT